MLKTFQKLLLNRVNFYQFARKSSKNPKPVDKPKTNLFGTKTPETATKKPIQVEDDKSEEISEDFEYEEGDERELIAKMQGKLYRSIEEELKFELDNPVNYHGKR
jgi:hypothetical protein